MVTGRPLKYRLSFTTIGLRVNIIDEAIEEVETPSGAEPYFYYTFQQGRPVINIRVRTPEGKQPERTMQWDDRSLDQSVLAQRKDPNLYPELYWLGWQFQSIQTFREWTFGRYGALRWPQRADLPERLLPDSSNLALVLNQIEHKSGPVFNEHLKRFFPRFERMSTSISGGTVQFYLHESGFRAPIPTTRLSDGTIRFIAMLATLLSPSPPPLVCMEEPELGLHPDAVALLADLLVEASQRMQLVVTTHSDAFVSALTNQPAAIVACERPGAGTVLRRLDPERLADWLDDYRLGDLWRMGELGANP
jgi:predicted ATPase